MNRFLKWRKSSFQIGLDLIIQDVHIILRLLTGYLELKRLRNGDLIFWERRLNENDNVCYTIEYKYDKRKNWISKKRFSQIKTKNGKLKKKKIKMIKTREIKYGI
jgi:hypothetical protein